jgi:hypothetical protein
LTAANVALAGPVVLAVDAELLLDDPLALLDLLRMLLDFLFASSLTLSNSLIWILLIGRWHGAAGEARYPVPLS